MVTLLSVAARSTMVWRLLNSNDQFVATTWNTEYGENKNSRSVLRWDFCTKLACMQRCWGSVVPLPSNKTIHRVEGLFFIILIARNFMETSCSNEVARKPGTR